MNDEHFTNRGSTRYLGEAGRHYFNSQNSGGLQQGAIEARKFVKHISPNDVVIDFGCGSGAVLVNLKCAKRIGVEINPVAREECARQGIEVYSSLDEIPSKTAQVVISNHALEHVPNPLATVMQISDKLMPGGRLYLCVPIDDWRVEKHVNVADINRHLYTWTPLLLGNMLDEAGFSVKRVRVLTHAWPPYWQKLDRYLPVSIFDVICTIYSAYKKRRQIFAEAIRPEK